jgi:hypothetical protein
VRSPKTTASTARSGKWPAGLWLLLRKHHKTPPHRGGVLFGALNDNAASGRVSSMWRNPRSVTPSSSNRVPWLVRDATRQLLRPTSPEEMETYLKDESEKYAQLIRRLALPLH